MMVIDDKLHGPFDGNGYRALAAVDPTVTSQLCILLGEPAVGVCCGSLHNLPLRLRVRIIEVHSLNSEDRGDRQQDANSAYRYNHRHVEIVSIGHEAPHAL